MLQISLSYVRKKLWAWVNYIPRVMNDHENNTNNDTQNVVPGSENDIFGGGVVSVLHLTFPRTKEHGTRKRRQLTSLIVRVYVLR